jgi:hypothetical protein
VQHYASLLSPFYLLSSSTPLILPPLLPFFFLHPLHSLSSTHSHPSTPLALPLSIHLSQTALADATEQQVPGVLCCGVPGAGGVDALFALVIYAPSGDSGGGSGLLPPVDTRLAVERMWSVWSDSAPGRPAVCPLRLGAGEGAASGINAHEDMAW